LDEPADITGATAERGVRRHMIALPDNSASISFLRFLQRRQRETGKAFVKQHEAMDFLGLTSNKSYDDFIRPLQGAGLVSCGIGNVGLLLAGEEHVLSPDERAAHAEMRERLLVILEGNIATQARHTVELAQIVEEATNKSSNGGIKTFSNTFDLARDMNVDPYALRTVALGLIRDNLAETMGGSHQDRVAIRLRARDIKAMMEAHAIAYELGTADS